MELSTLTRKLELKVGLLIIMAICAIYGQAINHEFLSFDDWDYVSKNPHVQQGLSIDGLKWALSFQHKEGTYWHPLTWLSHMADVSMFGNRAGLHLCTNIFLHILNTLLLFHILHKTTNQVWLSALAATLFAVHPLNVETVAWVAERKNLLSTFFMLLTISAYIFYTKNINLFRYILVILIYLTGLMAKPMLVTLPFVLLLLDYWPLQRISFQSTSQDGSQIFAKATINQIVHLLLEKVPLMCIAVLAWYLVTASLNETFGVISFSDVPLDIRIKNFIVSYVAYFGKFFWPTNLAIYYPFPKSLPLLQVAVCAVFLVGITVAVFATWYRDRFIIFGWLWFTGTMFPVSGLVQAGLWPAMADRWAYVPFIGLFIIFSWSLKRHLPPQRTRHNILFSLLALIIISLGITSWKQTSYWKNNITVFGHTLAVTSGSYVAHNNYASALTKEGRIEDAIAHFYQAVAISPQEGLTRSNLISLLTNQGKIEEAKRVYEEGVQLQRNSFKDVNKSGNASAEKSNQKRRNSPLTQNPQQYPEEISTHLNTAREFSEAGRIDDAIQQYLKVIEVAPNNYRLLNDVALIVEQLGNTDQAISLLNKALVVAPENDELHYNLASSLARTGQTEAAEMHFRRALDINPEFVKAHNNLGILLAQQNRPEQAIDHFNQALKIDPSSVDGHINLGVILFHLGKTQEAVEHWQEAAKLAPDNKKIKQMLLIAKPG